MLSKKLREGTFGISFSIPDEWVVDQEKETYLQMHDPDSGVTWFLMIFLDLHMDLSEEHFDDLRRALEWPARSMFETMFYSDAWRDPKKEPATGKPRTSDPNWSPLIEAKLLELGGAPALQTIHRMAYEPTQEFVMGHLLVPLREGLFEARLLCIDHSTGFRESILGGERLAGKSFSSPDGMKAVLGRIPQSYYDDPAHDAAFPHDALSRAREALRWLREDASLRVSAPAPERRSERVANEPKGYSFVPPPRFVATREGTELSLHRVSFCGTDGLQWLTVSYLDRAPRSQKAFKKIAFDIAHAVHKASEVREIKMEMEDCSDEWGRRAALVRVEGVGHDGPLENTMAVFVKDGQLWSAMLTQTRGIPEEVVRSDLMAVVLSFELLADKSHEEEASDPRPTPKKWWWPF